MITFTKMAAKHIQDYLAQDAGANAFRLSVKQTGCTGYAYVPELVAEGQENDKHFVTEEGLNVYIDAKYIDYLQGTEIDYVEKSFGQSQLMFKNPNVESECGCGESVNFKAER